MKKSILIILLLLFQNLNAQNKTEPESKLQFYSISFTPLSIYSNASTGGPSFYFDVGLNMDAHIFKTAFLNGSELSFFGGRRESFYEIDLMYGREFINEKVVKLDGFIGLGYFEYKYIDRSKDRNQDYITETNITLPIQTSLRFQTGRSFSLGLQFHASLNTTNSIFNTSIILQWLL